MPRSLENRREDVFKKVARKLLNQLLSAYVLIVFSESGFEAISAVHLKCDKKFECDHCAKVFYVKRGVLTHMRVHIIKHQSLKARIPTIKQRQESKKVPNKLRPFACSYKGCYKSYGKKVGLIQHDKRIHSGEFRLR